MSDVLAFTVPAPRTYPSVNTMWAQSVRRGKKTPDYHELFDAVYARAQEEIRRTGWTCADYPVHTTITLYHRTGIFPDASNLGKVENDALTAAGAWVDDKLARPYVANTEYDPNGESRVVIVLRRRFPPYVSASSGVLARTRKRAASAARGEAVAAPPPPAKPGKVVFVDGKAVPYDEAMRDLKLSQSKGKKR